MYARLLFFKELSARIAAEDPKSASKVNPVATALGIPSLAELAQLDDRAAHADHFYDLMLESCERLFDNEIEQHVFEEQMRYMFGVKVCLYIFPFACMSSCSGTDFGWQDAYRIFTIDKVIGALIKQVGRCVLDGLSYIFTNILRVGSVSVG